MIRATLCYIIQDGKVLLIEKLRGFGKGRFNGPGGKLKLGENPVDCVIRETFEETGILVFGPQNRGRLHFFFGEGKNEPDWVVDIFLSTDWAGKMHGSSESEPGWFNLTNLPLEKMWPDDQYWLPLFLAGKHFEGKFWFDEDGTKVLRHELGMVGGIIRKDTATKTYMTPLQKPGEGKNAPDIVTKERQLRDIEESGKI